MMPGNILINAIINNRPEHEIDSILQDPSLDINDANEFGETALHIACNRGKILVVQKLLKKGARYDVVDDIGQTPMHNAAKSGDTEIMEELFLRGANLHALDCMGKTPLAHAVIAGKLAMVQWLAGKKDVDIHQRCYTSNTLLHWAAGQGHTPVAFFLIGRRAEVNATNSTGATPLHIAASRGHQSIVSLLIACKAKEEIADKLKLYPVHYAYLNRNDEIIRLLEDYTIKKMKKAQALQIRRLALVPDPKDKTNKATVLFSYSVAEPQTATAAAQLQCLPTNLSAAENKSNGSGCVAGVHPTQRMQPLSDINSMSQDYIAQKPIGNISTITGITVNPPDYSKKTAPMPIQPKGAKNSQFTVKH